MNTDSITWAMKRPGLTAIERRVLVAVAVGADENDESPAITLPWLEAIATITGLDVAGVLRALYELNADCALEAGGCFSVKIMRER